MKAHLSNALYGVVDYAAYPAAMLLAAPIILRHLGIAEYGVWVVTTAAVSTGGIIASGFGDANIQYVASARGQGNADAFGRAVRSMIGINMLLGTLCALISWAISPLLARHIVPSNAELQLACLWSLRIASLLMLVRAIESICISTQRAFERYGAAVRISILGRLLTQAAAVILALRGFGVVCIMVFTAIIMTLATVAQLARIRNHLGIPSLFPAFDRNVTSALLSFGIFTWLQAVASVIFSQVDRLVLGVSLGASVVTAYALCVQIAQPIYGFASSGLHFFFPYLSGRQASLPATQLRTAVLTAFCANLLFVFASTAAVLLFGREVLRLWVGEAIARNASNLRAPIAWSFALLGLNVTAYYSLLGFGRVRTVTFVSLAGGAAMLLLMVWLLPIMGARGAALARLACGAATVLLYIPVIRILRGRLITPVGTTSAGVVWEGR
jgi:O-antigen/teichoic acid export membrane protein